MYHLIFIVKIKNIMTVCILGNSLTALTLAKVLVNYEIHVDVIFNKKNHKINVTRTIGISKNMWKNYSIQIGNDAKNKTANIIFYMKNLD